MKLKEVAMTAVRDLWALSLQRGYVGPTYDAQEEKNTPTTHLAFYTKSNSGDEKEKR